METKQFCTFHLDNLFFGVNVLKVQEIIRFHEMTMVPLANSVIRGLINLRGQIVTAFDLRQRLGLEPKDMEELLNVIVYTSDAAVSLLVDEIGDVLEIETERFEPPPNNLDPKIKHLVHGVYKLEDELLLILDTEKTVDIDTRSAEISQ